jgi:hypothetical protein
MGGLVGHLEVALCVMSGRVLGRLVDRLWVTLHWSIRYQHYVPYGCGAGTLVYEDTTYPVCWYFNWQLCKMIVLWLCLTYTICLVCVNVPLLLDGWGVVYLAAIAQHFGVT